MKKILFAAVAATVLFASCAKEENGVRDNGAEAKMDLTIAFPQTETRAVDGNATAQDVAVKSITVFIFNTDGTHADGSPANFDETDISSKFTVDATNNKYTLKESDKITTKSGTKKIYVGLNLPTALSGAADESVLIDAASTANLYNGTTSVAMLSAGVSKNLQAQEEGVTETPAANKIEVPVVRLVAKIAVTHGSASYNVDNTAGGIFTIAPDQFTVGNLAPNFYPVQRVVSNKLVTPLMTAPTAPLALADLNASGTDAKDLTSTFYVPEHATSSENLRGEATYAVVRGELTFTNLATIEGGVISISPAGPTGNVYVVKKGSDTYFCATEEMATAIAEKLAPGAEKQTYEPTAGKYYTYYYLFINRDEMADRLAVYRNQLINLKVNGVSGIGVPGDPSAPTVPPVVPPKKEEPVFGSDALLEVIVDVQAWSYDGPTTVELE